MTKKDLFMVYCTLVLGAVAITLGVYLDKIDVGQAIYIIVTIILVAVTAVYAMRTLDIAKATKEQAAASIKMAEEMKQQRYDVVRPVIDITIIEPQPLMINVSGETPQEEESRYISGLYCLLTNIGIGPALDAYSYTITVGGEHILKEIGNLTTEQKIPLNVLLSPEKKDEHWFLVVYYRDIYDRLFESRREIRFDKEKGIWHKEKLNIHPTEKQDKLK